MTDKERLENIKFLRNSEKTVAPGMQPSELISRKDVDWLIQQAERVEELEELEQEYVDLNSDFTKLALENKRYREILSYVREIDCVDWSKEELAEIARQALEGEE